MLAGKAKTAVDLVGAGILTPTEARVWLADEHVIDGSMVTDDTTPGITLADNDNTSAVQEQAIEDEAALTVVKSALIEPTDAPGKPMPDATVEALLTRLQRESARLAQEAINAGA
jgi:hypothetical protein